MPSKKKLINNETRTQIKNYLEKWLKELIKKEKSKDGTSKPFHEALLPKEVIRSSSLERSLSTGLGKSFEECAKLIGLQNFKISKVQHETKGLVSKKAIQEIEKMANYVKTKGRPDNYLDFVHTIVSIKQKPSVTRRSISDLYLMDNKGREIFFELKSPKPNKGQCVEVLERQLQIHAINRTGPPEAKTYYAMAYNPWGDSKSDYKHPFSVKYLDMENHVLLGKDFWNFLGGKRTNEELLAIYKEVGRSLGTTKLDNVFSDP